MLNLQNELKDTHYYPVHITWLNYCIHDYWLFDFSGLWGPQSG